MSTIQLIGIGFALCFIVIGARALRQERADTFYPPTSIFTGVLLLVVAVFPNTAGVLNEMLAIGKFTGSRLIALLIIVVLVLWIFVTVIAGRERKLNRQFDRLIRNEVVDRFLLTSGGEFKGSVLCLVPAFNEAENLKSVLGRFPKEVNGVPVHVLVVDDGSTDRTAEVVKSMDCALAKVPVNRGGGSALRTGFDIAILSKAAAIITIDADGQNDPEAISLLAEPILRDEADIILGSRILGEHEITHWWRHLGVVFFSWMINTLMGTKITDCSTGYRAIATNVVSELDLFQDQYHTSEFLILAAKKGLRIAEKPIVFRKRISDKSKKGNEILYAFRFLYVLINTWLRGK